MLPALTPTQTVSGSDSRRSASPDCRIQWHRYVASPPSTSRTSASRTQGTQRSSLIVGSADSSRRPSDFHSIEVMPPHGGRPLTNPRAETGPHKGWPHCAVGMHSAVASAIGLPSRPTSASRMLVFVTPPEVREASRLPPVRSGHDALSECREIRCMGIQTGLHSETHRRCDLSCSARISTNPCVGAGHVIGRLLDLSHISWQICVAHLASRQKRMIGVLAILAL